MYEFRAGFVYSALVFGTGFILGCVRVPFLAPRLGERWAELAEMPVMAAAVVYSARLVERRFSLSTDVATRLAVGGIGLIFLLAAELALVRPLRDESIAEYVAGKDRLAGTVYVAMLGLYTLMPLLLARHGRKAEDRVKEPLPSVPEKNLFLS